MQKCCNFCYMRSEFPKIAKLVPSKKTQSFTIAKLLSSRKVQKNR